MDCSLSVFCVLSYRTVFCPILRLIYLLQGFPGGSAGKESAHNAGGLGSIPGLGRSPGEGKGYPLQYSGLENSMDYIVLGAAKSQTRLSDFHLLPITKFLFIVEPKTAS